MNFVEITRLNIVRSIARVFILTLTLLSLLIMVTPSFAQSTNRCFATRDDGTTVFSSTNSSAVRNVIAQASEGDTIKIAGYCSDVQVINTQLALITKTLTLSGGYTETNWITASPANETVLDALSKGRVFSITAESTLERLTIMNGRSTKSGGGINTTAHLTLTNVTVISNTQTGFNIYGGGGIYAMGSLTITGGQFEFNKGGATGSGGAVWVLGSVMVSGTTFSNNTAETGAAISALGTAMIESTQFVSNTTGLEGGALYLSSGGEVAQSIFIDNRSTTKKGGAIYSLAGPLNLTKTTFLRNLAKTGGGAVAHLNSESDIAINNSLFARNGSSTGAQVMELTTANEIALLHNTIVSTTVSTGAALIVSGTANITSTIIASFTTGISLTTAGVINENYNLFENVTKPTLGTAVNGGSSFPGFAVFVDPSDDNYQLGADSYAIDSGAASSLTDDFYGDPRPQQLAPDIGYDETSLIGATFSVNDVLANEGASGTTFFTMTVSLSTPRSLTTSVEYEVSDGTTTVGTDYTPPATGVVTFSPNITVGYIVIYVLGDLTVEANETLTVTLRNAQVAGIGDGVGLGTIKNDDTTQLAISDSALSEGNSGNTTAIFTVTLTHPSELPVKVNFSTNNSTAQAGSDYTSASGTLTFTAMQTTLWITVNITGDLVVETNEIFRVTLSGASNAGIVDNSGGGTILNDDAAEVYIADSSVSEGNSGTVNANFIVTLTNPSSASVEVNFITSDSTAISATDYQPISGTIIFSAMQTSKSVTVTVNSDSVVESDEHFNLNLSNPKGATIGDGQATGLIQNDDAASLSIGNRTVTEGVSGTINASFVVSLSQPSSFPVTITYASSNNSAIADVDYQPISGTTTFAPLQTMLTLTVPITGDIVVESNETFNLSINSAVGASINNGNGVGTISNDDANQLTISDVSVSEGNSGVTSAVFILTLSNPSELAVTVEFATGGGSAVAGNDYATTSGLLAFPALTTQMPITIEVSGDVLVEGNETFNIVLLNPSNTSITDDTGVATILNEDSTGLSISELDIIEGDSGVSNAMFTITLSNPSAVTVTVAYATSNKSALAGSDYQPTTGTVTFTPAQTTGWALVPILGDSIVETDETFTVTLSTPVGAALIDNLAIGTIVNDDAATISISDASVGEGNSGTQTLVFTLTLDRPSSFPVSVNYASEDGSASAGADYQAVNSSVDFAPLQMTQWVSMTVNGDTLVENHESLALKLSGANGASIGDETAIGTIKDDDATIVAISDISVIEGDSGVTSAVFTLTLTTPSALPVTVTYFSEDAGASSGLDYETANNTVTFAPLQVVQLISVQVKGDTIVENNEDFKITLLAATGQTLIAEDAGVGLATIFNDDATSISVNDIDVNEGDSGFTLAVFAVNLSNPSALTVSVEYETTGGTASDGSDFAGSNGTITFAPLQTTRLISIPVAGDNNGEGNESFVLTLRNAVGALISDGDAISIIVDNDNGPNASINDTSVVEGNSGVVNAIFTVSLSEPSTSPVKINYITGGGVAASGEDYQSTSGMLVFAPGQSTQTISVPVNGDTLVEADETFSVTITAVENIGSITDSTGTATILDDDSTTSNKFNAYLPLVTR